MPARCPAGGRRGASSPEQSRLHLVCRLSCPPRGDSIRLALIAPIPGECACTEGQDAPLRCPGRVAVFCHRAFRAGPGPGDGRPVPPAGLGAFAPLPAGAASAPGLLAPSYCSGTCRKTSPGPGPRWALERRQRRAEPIFGPERTGRTQKGGKCLQFGS